MTALKRVLVTGASGNVGSATVTALRAVGIPVRAADRDGQQIANRFPTTEFAHFDFLDPSTFDAAVDGCDAIFLLRPPPISRMKHTLNQLIDVAARRGIKHVIFSSVAGANTNRVVPHHRVETHLASSGLAFTILRPGFFAQNLGDAYRDDIFKDHRLFVPAGNGRVAFVDVRDVGEIAANIFLAPQLHIGKGYELSGPRALTFQEVANTLTAELGRPIRYEAASVHQYVHHLWKRNMPLIQIMVQTILHVRLRKGDTEHVGETTARLLGHPPRSMETYVHDHLHLWQVSSA